DISFRKLLKVKGIVLIEPVYKNPFEQLKLGRGTEHLAEALADFFSRHVRSHRCIETDMNRIGKNRLSYIISSFITMPLSIEVECISNMSKYDWKKAVKEIKVPVRIIAGEKDEFAKVGSLGELIAGLKNCSLKIVRNGRHTMIVEETGKVGKLVEEAVEEIIS
ncbi:alpha/beta hydrolase, partial [Candidatus Woesearchaeota archaeon]